MIIMQLKFLLSVILFLLCITFSDCLKCYQNLDGSKSDETAVSNEDTKATCEAGEVCSSFIIKAIGKKTETLQISGCKPKKECEEVKKSDGKEFSEEEALKKLQSIFGPADGEPKTGSKVKISVKCCDKDMCNALKKDKVTSASTKMARYFLGLALSITFLNVFFL